MYLYTGPTKTFFQYTDGATGQTLTVEAGNVYHIEPTTPELPVVPYGYAQWFEPVKSEPDADDKPPVSPTPEEATMTGESGVDHTESE
jgi:hypothetical protein